jgi:hypothetical protein
MFQLHIYSAMKLYGGEIYLDLLILESLNVEKKCVTFPSHFGACNINESCNHVDNNLAMSVRLSSYNNSGMLNEFLIYLIADLLSGFLNALMRSSWLSISVASAVSFTQTKKTLRASPGKKTKGNVVG